MLDERPRAGIGASDEGESVRSPELFQRLLDAQDQLHRLEVDRSRLVGRLKEAQLEAGRLRAVLASTNTEVDGVRRKLETLRTEHATVLERLEVTRIAYRALAIERDEEQRTAAALRAEIAALQHPRGLKQKIFNVFRRR